MRALSLAFVLFACSSKSPVQAPPAADPARAQAPPSPPVPKKEVVAADTPRTTVTGNTFVAPAGWTIWVDGPATVLEAPEGDSRIAFVDLQAKDADAAVALAWRAYKPAKTWPLLNSAASPDKDGWTKVKEYGYQTSPNEQRGIAAAALFANETWTVVIVDVARATAEKRGGQLGVLFGRLLPKGGVRESFAGKQAHALDAGRVAQLTKFVEDSQKVLGAEGVALGLYEKGKVVFAGGFGPRQLGKPAKIDADTRFIIASNTKALTTLMLAKLVDENKLTWETPATKLLPSFKLGDAETTSKVLVKHLICACTGMPRQDMEFIFEFRGLTPTKAVEMLGRMQPTSKFGELFQYSNLMAAAAGFIGGHVAYPTLELGAAYDKAMQTRVFDPLGMKATTFDYKKAQTGNFALPTAFDIEGKAAPGPHAANYSPIPVRPAGAAWSTVRDMLKYVAMELSEGKLPDGKQYVSKEALLARRAPQVAVGKDTHYGMGLLVDTTYGVPVVTHGGDVFGFHSTMLWFPEQGVGAVILTNSERASVIRDVLSRKLLEVLFDGKPEADAEIASSQQRFHDGLAVMKKQLTVPADPALASRLAPRYVHPTLGEIKVTKKGAAIWFDFGEFKSEMASKQNADGTVSFITIMPGFIGQSFMASTTNGKRSLVMRDAQHEYPFTEP
ncbi:MAG: serine hydrolase domain-containing protein [Kofleriaceae bacterium]